MASGSPRLPRCAREPRDDSAGGGKPRPESCLECGAGAPRRRFLDVPTTTTARTACAPHIGKAEVGAALAAAGHPRTRVIARPRSGRSNPEATAMASGSPRLPRCAREPRDDSAGGGKPRPESCLECGAGAPRRRFLDVSTTTARTACAPHIGKAEVGAALAAAGHPRTRVIARPRSGRSNPEATAMASGSPRRPRCAREPRDDNSGGGKPRPESCLECGAGAPRRRFLDVPTTTTARTACAPHIGKAEVGAALAAARPEAS